MGKGRRRKRRSERVGIEDRLGREGLGGEGR
jgi:hypothetical protein